MSGQSDEIDAMPYVRGNDTEFHKIYFPKELAKFIHEVGDGMQLSFPDTVRLIINDSHEKFKLFEQMEEGDYLVFNFDGFPEIMKPSEFKGFHEDLFRDVT